MAEILGSKPSNSSNKYSVLSVDRYYSYLGLSKKFDLLPTKKDYILEILRDIDTTKAAGIYRLPGRCVKDGVEF